MTQLEHEDEATSQSRFSGTYKREAKDLKMEPIDRRQFLASAGGGLTALLLSSVAFAQGEAPPVHPVDGATMADYATTLAKGGFFLMIAEWELKDGNIERAKAIINAYRPFILKAEGIKIFLAAQDAADPHHILFYEAYETEELYKKHAASEAFQKYIVQEGLPLVARRTLTRYHLI